MSQQPQHVSLDQAIGTFRNNIVLGHSKSEEIALDSFDKIVSLIQQQGTTITEKDKEIKRLQDLCKENKIDTNPKESKPTEGKPNEVKASK